MILLSDKNSGPMVVNRDDYVKAIMDQHSSNRETFKNITKEKTTEHLLEDSNAHIECIYQTGNSIDINDMKHIMRCLDQDKRIPEICGLGKFHAGKIFPPPPRPVVAIIGSQLHTIGRWMDTCLNELLPFYKTHIKNSDDVLKILIDFRRVCDDNFATTCNAEAMRPNFNTEEGLGFAMEDLDVFIFKVKPGWTRK